MSNVIAYNYHEHYHYCDQDNDDENDDDDDKHEKTVIMTLSKMVNNKKIGLHHLKNASSPL